MFHRRQLPAEHEGIGGSGLRIFRKQPGDELIQLRRNAGDKARQRRRLFEPLLVQHFAQGRGAKRRPAGQHGEHHAPQAV